MDNIQRSGGEQEEVVAIYTSPTHFRVARCAGVGQYWRSGGFRYVRFVELTLVGADVENVVGMWDALLTQVTTAEKHEIKQHIDKPARSCQSTPVDMVHSAL